MKTKVEKVVLMKFIFGLTTTYLNTNLARKLAVLFQDSYEMFVIDDEMVPLSSGAVKNYYTVTVCVILSVAVLIGFVSWALRRKQLVKRLMELRMANGNDDSLVPFSIKNIKEEISNEEMTQAAKFI